MPRFNWCVIRIDGIDYVTLSDARHLEQTIKELSAKATATKAKIEAAVLRETMMELAILDVDMTQAQSIGHLNNKADAIERGEG